MIPADLLNALREKDPELWEKIAETALSEYEYHDEDFNEWISNAITYTNLFGPAQEAWLRHCLQEAIRARGWAYTLTYNPPSGPSAPYYDVCIWPTATPIHVKADTEAEALLRAYLAAIP